MLQPFSVIAMLLLMMKDQDGDGDCDEAVILIRSAPSSLAFHLQYSNSRRALKRKANNQHPLRP